MNLSNLPSFTDVLTRTAERYKSALAPSPCAHTVKYTQISAGNNHTCAVFENGSAQCWGSNFYGELGIGDVSVNNRPTPQWVIAPSCTFDIDDDGNVSALTDGLMIVRAMLGMNRDAVISGLTGATATRPTWPQIRAHLSASCGLQGLAP